jgi:hypothetical protein
MPTGQASVLTAGFIALACLLPSCTLEQILIGQLYTIRTPPTADCPELAWQFFVDPERNINGSLSRDTLQPVASLSGRLNPDDSFRMTVTDLAGGRTASATGQFTAQVSTIAIQGDGAGKACDGKVFSMRLGNYFARQGGGGGGGGN